MIQKVAAVLSEGSRTSLDCWPFAPLLVVSPAAARFVGTHGVAGMALGQDPQVVHELVAVLHAVFEEEAVTDVVVGHVVLNAQVIRAMHGHAAAVGVVNRGVLDVLPLRIADQMPVDRIPGKIHVLTHAIELDALDKHLAPAHRHHVPAEE